jgi:predicted transcriptional regulator
MNACYQTLSTIYDIVKTDPTPTTYLCTPHEIILRHNEDWTSIQKHLEVLAAEKLVAIKQLDKIVVCITSEGIAKAKMVKNNFVNKAFKLPSEKSTDLTINDRIDL